jgi:hypothetical protein
MSDATNFDERKTTLNINLYQAASTTNFIKCIQISKKKYGIQDINDCKKGRIIIFPKNKPSLFQQKIFSDFLNLDNVQK